MPSRRVELSVYLAIALLGVVPTILSPGSVVGDGVDAFGTHWFYWWIRTCLEHLADPSYTNLFFYPSGKDIFAHTGNNFVDAVLAAPFAWIFGNTLYSPMWTVALQLGNAAGFRPLARHVLGDTFAAFAATVLWMVNPFVIFEITAGRPTQGMCWFLPVAVLYFLRCAREPGWRNALWLGLAVAMTGWTYWFAGYFLALLLVPLAAYELREAPDRRGVLLRWGLAVLVCFVLVAPGIVMMSGAIGEGRVPGIDPSSGSIFSPPTPIANNVSSDLHGIWLMEFYGSPLLFQPAWGLPLLAAPWVKDLPIPGGRARWVAMFVFVLLFAGGTVFRWGDFTVVMPHYMALYRYLPFFDRLWFPYRMASVLFVPAAILVGALCARSSRPRVALAVLLGLGLGGELVTGTWPFNHRVARAPALVASLKEQGGGVIFLPVKIQHDGLMWQTEFQLPTFGGMGESASIFWPTDWRRRLDNSLIRAMRGAAIDPSRSAKVLKKDRTEIQREGFRWVILRRTLLESELRRQLEARPDAFDKWARIDQTIAALSDIVGSPPAGVDGDAVVWDLTGTFTAPRPEWAATPENLGRRGWEEVGMAAYEENLKWFGRTGGVREKTQANLPK